MRGRLKIIIIIFVLLTPLLQAFQNQQKNKDSVLKAVRDAISNQDTTALFKMLPDSLKKLSDTLHVKKSSTGLDSLVVYSAKDSVVFNVKNKRMRLRGQAKLDYKVQKLESEIITLFFDESLLEADCFKDSSGKRIGFPKFTDRSENFVGEKILYNFKSNQGTINLGETQMSEGYYFGEKIKRVSPSELFVKDGCYTSCDAPHPHYYFGSPEMKVIAQDRVMLDPLIFYVEDMPVFILPVGLFFPNKSGRQSGLIIPSFFFSATRGVTFENFGLYLALSDYYDTKFSANYYSKGGYNLKNNTVWKLRDVFDGAMEVQYGKTRFNPDDNYTTNWSFNLRHSHTITPQSQLVANLSFMSQDFNRNTTPDIRLRIQQNMTSNASFSQSFDNGSNFSISYNRSQNIMTNEYSQTPSISYSLPQWFVLKPYVSPNSWLKDINVSYSGNANYSQNKSLFYPTHKINDSTYATDTTFKYSYSTRISHNPSISISPKFGYFTVSPSIGIRANNYFRRIRRSMNTTDSTLQDVIENGFFTEYGYDVGVSVSTRLYGIVKPKLFGLNAFRHTFQPSIRYSFTPDQSTPSQGFWSSYTDLHTNQQVKYSRFALDGGGISSSMRSQNISYSLNNNFGAKIAQGDTAQDKAVDLFSFSLNGSYNMVADSLKFSDISMSFHSPAISNLSLNGNAAFTLYDESRIINSETNLPTDYFTRINKFLAGEGKGLARLTSFSLSLSTNFNSSGMNSSGSSFSTDTTKKKDSIGIGERFQQRMEGSEAPFDFFGDNSPGYSTPALPWNISLSLNYYYNRPFLNQKTQTLTVNAGLTLRLTDTWSIDGNAQYDFQNHELITPTFNIKKDMHCWDLVFTWYPIGPSQGYYLRFAIKAPQLKDLKFEKRNNPLF